MSAFGRLPNPAENGAVACARTSKCPQSSLTQHELRRLQTEARDRIPHPNRGWKDAEGEPLRGLLEGERRNGSDRVCPGGPAPRARRLPGDGEEHEWKARPGVWLQPGRFQEDRPIWLLPVL